MEAPTIFKQHLGLQRSPKKVDHSRVWCRCQREANQIHPRTDHSCATAEWVEKLNSVKRKFRKWPWSHWFIALVFWHVLRAFVSSIFLQHWFTTLVLLLVPGLVYSFCFVACIAALVSSIGFKQVLRASDFGFGCSICLHPLVYNIVLVLVVACWQGFLALMCFNM